MFFPSHVAQAAAFDLGNPASQTTSFAPTLRTGLSRSLSVQDVHALDQQGFAPFDSRLSYPVNDDQAIWLSLRVHAAEHVHTPLWTLTFSKPFVDRITLYYRDATGNWQSEAAGNYVAHSDWPLPRLEPQFLLPSMAAGEHTLYVKVEHDVPMRFELQLMSEARAQKLAQSHMLVAGLTLGLMGLIAVLCAVMAWSYRERVFAYYGLYVLAAFFFVAGLLGVARYAWWPQAIHWGGVATLVFALLSLAAQLQFCRQVFLRAPRESWWPWAVNAAVIGTVMVAASLSVHYSQLLLSLFGLSVMVCIAMMLCLVVRALRLGSRMALWWLLSYTPLYLVLIVAMFDHLGLAAAPWLPYNAPAYAIVMEVVILMAVLHQYGKVRDAQRVRARTLTRTDPATGFLTVQAFDKLCKRLWRDNQEHDADMALAYVQVLPGRDAQQAARWTTEAGVQRAARLLHQVLRSQDWVCRAQDDTLVIVMPGMRMGDALTERFSRLVALGMMSDKHDAQNLELRFCIAVGTQGSYPGGLAELRHSLQTQLAQAQPHSQPPITYLSLSDDLPSQSELEDMWEHALAATKDKTESAKSMAWQGR